VNLGKLVEFDEVMEDVEKRGLDVADALERVETVAAAPSRYPALVSALGFGVASSSAAAFFGGGVREIAASFVLAIGIFLLRRIVPQRPDTIGLYEPLAAFLAALAAYAAGRTLMPLDDRVVTLASLIILVPGLTLTVGFTELAARHLASGVARLAGAATIFLTLLFGVALAWRLGGLLWPNAPQPVAVPLPDWSLWVTTAVAPFAFAVLLEARPREFLVIFGASVLGYAATRLGTVSVGNDLGPFLGALVVGVCSNTYARLANRPALVPLTPGILLLVPGSLGFRSLTSFLDAEALAGMAWAFQTGLVAASLVGGLLAANLVLPPRRVL
jgi:uncharacterized membrane protein YjjP (DUF1212 family)